METGLSSRCYTEGEPGTVGAKALQGQWTGLSRIRTGPALGDREAENQAYRYARWYNRSSAKRARPRSPSARPERDLPVTRNGATMTRTHRITVTLRRWRLPS